MNAAAILAPEPALGASGEAPAPVRLSLFRLGESGTVLRVGQPQAAMSTLERRLMELGFVHGEHVEVLAEARPGRDPLVIRVGGTTLALRRREVESVWVTPESKSP